MEGNEYQHDQSLESLHHHDMVSVRHDIAHLDKRVAVVEAKIEQLWAQHVELKMEIRSSGAGIEDSIAKVMQVLEGHIAQEQQDRVQLLWSAMTALAAALSTLALWAVPKLWGLLVHQVPLP